MACTCCVRCCGVAVLRALSLAVSWNQLKWRWHNILGCWRAVCYTMTLIHRWIGCVCVLLTQLSFVFRDNRRWITSVMVDTVVAAPMMMMASEHFTYFDQNHFFERSRLWRHLVFKINLKQKKSDKMKQLKPSWTQSRRRECWRRRRQRRSRSFHLDRQLCSGEKESSFWKKLF